MAVSVVLIGLPGVGKTSVGRALAALLSLPFADSDDLVQEMTGRRIGDIIADDGEAAFRDIEAAAIAGALLDRDGVLALGGGAVTSAPVRAELAATGVPVVRLTAPEAVVLARIGNTQHRPLLAGDTAHRLRELAEAREGFYAESATLTVDTEGIGVTDVAALLARALGPEAEHRNG
jgi:shikimate kinase